MKVKVLAAVVMSLVIGRAASAAEVCNAPSGLNFRSGPSLHSNVKDVFQESSSFKVLSHHGSWDKVRTAGGRVGYVYSAYVCKSGGSHPATRPSSGIAHWRNPVLGTCVTSPFGRRHSPTPGASSFHQGTDLGAPCGSQVHAAAPGRVIFTGYVSGFGYMVEIAHPNGIVSIYGHLSRILAHVGERPGASTVIARSGNTGISTGCHLHFEVRRGGVAFNAQSLIGFGRCPRFGRSTGTRYISR